MNSRIFIFSLFVLFATSTSAMADSFSPSFYSCIQNNETGGAKSLADAAKVVNSAGYTGIYQMGVNYVGGYLCSNYASIPTMPPGKENWSLCNFNGTLSGPPYNIKSYADFTTGPNAVAAQNYIMQKNSESMWNQIVAKGYDKYVGQTINGVTLTKDTMVAMAHLTGMGGLQTTLNGGTSVDGNKTSTTSYAGCLASCMAGTSTGSCASSIAGMSVWVNVCTGKPNANLTDEEKSSPSGSVMPPMM